MTTSAEINGALDDYIRPASFPVGIVPLRRVAHGPPELVGRARRPAADGHPLTVCRGIGLSRRSGWTILLRSEDNVCPLAGMALGFEPPAEMLRDGSPPSPSMGCWQAACDPKETPHFDHGAYEGILLAPLHAGEFAPEVVVVYGNSAQVMRLVQAAVYGSGRHLDSRASGHLGCADLIVQPLLSGDCHVVLPCHGDRVFGTAQDDEMAFTMPRSRIPAVLEGLDLTHQAGQRFPIPAFADLLPHLRSD